MSQQLSIEDIPALQIALEALIDPVYVVDGEFNLLWVNQAYRQAFGYRPRKKLPCYEVAKLSICGEESCLLQLCRSSGAATRRFQEVEVAGSIERDASCYAGAFPLFDPKTSEVVGAVGILRDNSAEVRLHKRYGKMLEAERNRKELLETMVAERTQELTASNETLNEANINLKRSRREISEIFENISQAIMTIDENLEIGVEHSRFSESVFADTSLGGRAFPDLLVPEKASKDHKELVEWLMLVFHNPTMNWELAKSMAQTEYRFNRPDGTVAELAIDFEPIREQERIKRLMVLVEDLTEKRELQRTIDAKEQEMSENIDHLAALARLDPEMYEAILEEAQDIIGRSSETLRTLADNTDPGAVIDGLFRDMHTLKGNAMSYGLIRVAAKAHWVEDAFSQLRESASHLTLELIKEADDKVRELGELFIRIQDMASRVLSRKDVGVVRARKPKIELEQERIESLVSWAEQNLGTTPRELEMLERVRGLSLVPLNKLYRRFPRMIEDLSGALGKDMNPVQLVGGDELLTSNVFNKFAEVLVHLMRNSIDHGIESPAVRRATGKEARGTIALRSFYKDGCFWVEVDDDGGGIDPKSLIARAKAKGLIEAAEQPTGQDALNLIFLPGFSTTDRVTDTSGRGVGMDVVKSTVEALEGGITVDTAIGRGTTFRMWIPGDIARGKRLLPSDEG